MENNNRTTTGINQPPFLQTNRTLNLPPNPSHNHYYHHNDQDITFLGDEVNDETLLDKTLQQLELYLGFLGYNQTTILRFVLSWVMFMFVGIATPVLILEIKGCKSCQGYQVKDFEYDVLISQALLGFISLICVSHNLRKRGIRNFLFVDRHKGHTSRFMIHYIQKIKDSYCLLLWCLIPCGVLKLGHEIIRARYMQDQAWWQVCVVVSAMTMSWTYLSAITLVACVLFHLACTLQVIHFNDYEKLLERESNVLHLIQEHIRLRHYLSKISHRFRIYLILIFLMITSALFVALVQTTTNAIERVTFLNGGNLAVTSIVQVVETLLCLHAGTKISSKAHGITAVACKWHALATSRHSRGARRSNSFDITNSSSNSLLSLTSNCSDTDSESSNSVPSSHPASLSSYKERQSFVMYLQTNRGGITVYGWTVDRTLLTTIFFIELSLVLFVLGQTVIFNPQP